MPLRSVSEWLVCDACLARFPTDSVEGTPLPARRTSQCRACEGLAGVDALRIDNITLPEDFVAEMQNAVYACEQHGCGGGHYDPEEGETIGEDTNVQLKDVLYDHAQARPSEPFFALIAALAEADDDLRRIVEVPGISCRGCGADVDDWYADVKVRTYRALVHRLPEAPPEIRQISLPDLASRIEWWRSDSSTYLVHLTRAQRVATMRDNIEYEDHVEKLAAPEILWNILASSTLRAKRGKGLRAKAVCFTEKPLAALKDTIMGSEARVRRGTRSLAWSPYGLMFGAPPVSWTFPEA